MNTTSLQTISPNTNKQSVMQKVRQFSKDNHLHINEEHVDEQKPWGAYHYIDLDDLDHFINLFFSDYKNKVDTTLPLQPKYLTVAPHARLSWQYHHRRSEIWTVIFGPIAVAQSNIDEQPLPDRYFNGQLVELKKGERHRLIGLENWGLVAEIWQHTDPTHPSDESDIVRLQDDYNRG